MERYANTRHGKGEADALAFPSARQGHSADSSTLGSVSFNARSQLIDSAGNCPVRAHAADAPSDPAAAVSASMPAEPMAPISTDELPQGNDWGYQLKWDGVRILAQLDGRGSVKLCSRSMYVKNAVYPEIAAMLEQMSSELGPCLLDGEVVWWDGTRPNFQQVLKRERSRGASAAAKPDATDATANEAGTTQPVLPRRSPGAADDTEAALAKDEAEPAAAAPAPAAGLMASPAEGPVAAAKPTSTGLLYVLFDLLADESGDLRQLPYAERNRRLALKCPGSDPRMLVTELYRDGDRLWNWVEANRWEGVVAKRLSSPYREGKKHRDWFKKKTALLLDVDIVGLKWRSGGVASFVMAYNGGYLGSVSLGLNDALRGVIASAFHPDRSRPPAPGVCPFGRVPDDLKREQVQWLPVPFLCRVTGLEITSAGQLRHPKLVTFLPKEPLS